MSVIARVLLALVLLAPVLALARPVDIEYELPTTDCSGQPIGEIIEMEIYISAGPIPASDLACPADGESVDQPPETYSSLIAGDTSQGKTTVDLFPGPYFARARVRTANGWSNLSNQAEYEVPAAPSAPVIIRFGG